MLGGNGEDSAAAGQRFLRSMRLGFYHAPFPSSRPSPSGRRRIEVSRSCISAFVGGRIKWKGSCELKAVEGYSSPRRFALAGADAVVASVDGFLVMLNGTKGVRLLTSAATRDAY